MVMGGVKRDRLRLLVLIIIIIIIINNKKIRWLNKNYMFIIMCMH